MKTIIDDLRIHSLRPLVSPALLIEEFTPNSHAVNTVTKTRELAQKIIHGQDDRQLVIVGPCSIHDVESALEYGKKLQPLIAKHQHELCIMMRVYFEKPRTSGLERIN